MTEPWKNEPAEVNFGYGGRRCVMRRNHGGAWCGYTEILPGEKLYGKDYAVLVQLPEAGNKEVNINKVGIFSLFGAATRAVSEKNIFPLNLLVECHGGLTYADWPFWDRENHSWWFGFDCSHSGDLVPDYKNFGEATHRDVEYVQTAIRQMVDDLNEIQEKGEVVDEEEETES